MSGDPQQIITVKVQLPAWLWWKVATAAERSGVPAGGFIAHAIRAELDQVRIVNARGSQLDILSEEVSQARVARQRARAAALQEAVIETTIERKQAS